jgi:hypothetical protein
MAPETRGRTSTRCTATKRPVNSSQWGTVSESGRATVTLGSGGAGGASPCALAAMRKAATATTVNSPRPIHAMRGDARNRVQSMINLGCEENGSLIEKRLRTGC